MALKAVRRRFLHRPLPALWAALVLFAVAWAVYRPALNRVFVFDQLWYFAELDGGTSLMDGLRHYDYAASRRYWKGDEALFRPLLFVWLAVENSLFSYHHVWWNVANLAVHSLVALFLFQLLVTIQPSFWALPFALLFVVLKPPLELVVWNHLGGYLFACVLLAIGLRGFVQRIRGASTRSATVRFVFGFTAAGLFYEAMVPVSLVAALLIVFTERRRRRSPSRSALLVLFIPALVFTSMYVLHVLRVERFSYVDRPEGTIFAIRNVVDLMPRCVQTVADWIKELALPSASALNVSAFGRVGKSFSFDWNVPSHALNAVVILAGLIVIGCLLSWRHVKSVLSILALLVGTLFIYTGVISLGRPANELYQTSYYLYLPGLIWVVFTYALVDLDRIRGWKTAAGGAVFAALVALHAAESAVVARELGRVNRDASRLLVGVSRFVDDHKGEPGFTFAILAQPRQLDPDVSLREGYPDDPHAVVHLRRATEILFRRYYDDVNPKYVF